MDTIGKDSNIKESEVAKIVTGTDISKSEIEDKINNVDADVVQEKRITRPSKSDLKQTFYNYKKTEAVTEGSKSLYRYVMNDGTERYVINLDETADKYNRDKQRLIEKNKHIPELIREFGGKAARTTHVEYKGDEYIVKEGINGDDVENYNKNTLTSKEVESLKDTLASTYLAGLKDIGEDDIIFRNGEAYVIDYEKTVDEDKSWDYPKEGGNDFAVDTRIVTDNFENINNNEIIQEAKSKMDEEIDNKKYKEFDELPDYLIRGLEHTRYNYLYNEKKIFEIPDYMNEL